jgi:hypothetical protein
MSNSMGLNLKADQTNLSLGLNAEGRKITKRIIKFKGCQPIIKENL